MIPAFSHIIKIRYRLSVYSVTVRTHLSDYSHPHCRSFNDISICKDWSKYIDCVRISLVVAPPQNLVVTIEGLVKLRPVIVRCKDNGPGALLGISQTCFANYQKALLF